MQTEDTEADTNILTKGEKLCGSTPGASGGIPGDNYHTTPLPLTPRPSL